MAEHTGRRSTSAIVPITTPTSTKINRRPDGHISNAVSAYHRQSTMRCWRSKTAHARSAGGARSAGSASTIAMSQAESGALLCHFCNLALGYLRDDQASLVAALAYLGALSRDEPGSAAQRALAVHDVLPPWPTRRAILTCPPICFDAAARACGVGGRNSAQRP